MSLHEAGSVTAGIVSAHAGAAQSYWDGPKISQAGKVDPLQRSGFAGLGACHAADLYICGRR